MREFLSIVGDLNFGQFQKSLVHSVHEQGCGQRAGSQHRFERAFQNPAALGGASTEEEHGFIELLCGHFPGFEDRIGEGVFFPIVRIVVGDDSSVLLEFFIQSRSGQGR